MTDMSPEEAMAQQKANCIFCKIAGGEIPSKVVYDDERILAFLDINPAVPGHTLVTTKEHYPIMPLIPPEEFEHLFGKTPMLAQAISQGMIAQHITVFIANGGVAGQQSPHFLFHIMPREESDGLDSLNIPQNGINQSDIAPMIKQNLYSMMREHLTKQNKANLLSTGETVNEPVSQQPRELPVSPEPAPRQPADTQGPIGTPSADQLAKILDENPDIREVLEKDPDRLQQILLENPELRSLFGGIDLHLLSKQLNAAKASTPVAGEQSNPFIEQPSEPPADWAAEPENPAPSIDSPVSSEQDSDSGQPASEPQTVSSEQEEIIPAAQMTISQIFAFIEGKPKLRELILNNPEKLKELIPGNDRLKKFFDGVDADAVIAAYQRHAGGTNV